MRARSAPHQERALLLLINCAPPAVLEFRGWRSCFTTRPLGGRSANGPASASQTSTSLWKAASTVLFRTISNILPSSALGGSHMPLILFDDQGRVWDSRSASLRAALETRLSGQDLADFCVRNLGFVAAKQGDFGDQVWLRPSHVAAVALAAVLSWLADRKSARISVACSGDRRWLHEIHPSKDIAIQAIVDLVNSAQEQRQDTVRSRNQAPDGLPASSPLRPSLDRWLASVGRLGREQPGSVTCHAVDSRYVLLHAPDSSPRIIIKEVGAGMPAGAKHWLSRAVGMRFEDQPDTAYGRLCAEAYRRAKDREQPILEDVDAFVEWPGFGRQRRRYQRLILPFRAKGGDVYLLGMSFEDRSIDLRGDL